MGLLSRITQLAGSRTGVLAITSGGTLIVRTGSSMILTRLLSPEAFGIAGIINSIFFVFGMMTDLGFQSFIVRHERGDEPHFLDTIWTLHATRGFGLTALLVVTSPLAAMVLGKPEIALPMAVAASIFAFNGVSALTLMTALRHDGARKLSLIEFGLQMFQAIICILLAIWWRNYWALIASLVIGQLARTAITYLMFEDAVRRPARDKLILSEFMAFSRIVLASSTLTLIIAQSDKLVLARLFTLDEFGRYAIAVSLALAPSSFSDNYISRVCYPIFARQWREAPGQLADVFYGIRQKTSWLYGFGCGGLLGGASLLIAILYDPRYQPAALYLSLLMMASALRFPNFAIAELMTATGEIRFTLRANILRVAWLGVAGAVGFFTARAIGLVSAVGSVEIPVLVYGWFTLRARHLLKMREELLFLASILAGAVIGYAIARTALTLFPHL